MARIRTRRRRGTATLLLLAALLLVAAAGCTGDDDEDAAGTTAATDPTPPPIDAEVRLTLVATSSPREPYERLAPMFSRTRQGAGVLVEGSYGNTLEQTQVVAFGLPADVFAPGSEADLLGPIESEVIPRDWNDDEFGGMVTNSVVVFVVRAGNPKGIRSWSDLIRPGIRIVMANPATSGVARWAAVAAYGAQLEQGRTPAQARQYLEQLLTKTSLEGASARESFTAFARGNADVLLTSEAEAITAQRKGSTLEHVVPDETILIESPISVTTNAPPEAQVFVDFLRSAPAQRVFAEEGHRPVLESARALANFPEPSGLFTIKELGSWRDVHVEFFATSGVVSTILRELGKTGD
ncbi:MAG: extracellular solute-binding protein [Actinomycetota bacterium]|nr:extracellular solute-binding protein [Actinomycetota bacterium]